MGSYARARSSFLLLISASLSFRNPKFSKLLLILSYCSPHYPGCFGALFSPQYGMAGWREREAILYSLFSPPYPIVGWRDSAVQNVCTTRAYKVQGLVERHYVESYWVPTVVTFAMWCQKAITPDLACTIFGQVRKKIRGESDDRNGR